MVFRWLVTYFWGPDPPDPSPSPSPFTIYDEIDQQEYVFHSRRPRARENYIGSYVYLDPTIVLGSVVSPTTFFHYPSADLHEYLVGYDILPFPEQAVHIVQIIDPYEPGFDSNLGDVYFYSIPIVVKTHWIRLVQRTWKRVFRERMRVLQIRKSLASWIEIERTGLYPEGARTLPGIHGMLVSRFQ